MGGRRGRALALLVLGLALAGPLRAADDELLLVAPGELDELWKLDRDSWRDAVPADALRALGIGCAAVAFVIEADGRTSGARVLRDTPEGTFVEAAGRIASNLRFAPTRGNAARQPVYTYLTISFFAESRERIGSHVRRPVEVGDREDRLCRVAGFAPGSGD
jgi:hypothetical protein